MIDAAKIREGIARLRRLKAWRLSNCYRAILLEADGRTAKVEAQRILADQRRYAQMDKGNFPRDREGRMDPVAMARIEGRREQYRRMIEFLNLDPEAVRKFAEVDDE